MLSPNFRLDRVVGEPTTMQKKSCRWRSTTPGLRDQKWGLQMDIVTYVLITAATSAVTGSGIGWLVSRSIDHGLNRNLEWLKAQCAIDVEQRKSELAQSTEMLRRALDAAEFEPRKVRTMLLERRANIIADLHALIVEMQEGVGHMVTVTYFSSTDSDEAKKMKDARFERGRKSYREFAAFFLKHEVFFTDSLAQKLHDLREHVVSSMMSFDFSQDQSDLKGSTKKWSEADRRMRTEVKQISEELKREFRELLGVSTILGGAPPQRAES